MMGNLSVTLAVPCYSFPQRCGSGLSGFNITRDTLMSCPPISIYRSATRALSFTIGTMSSSSVRWSSERADNG